MQETAFTLCEISLLAIDGKLFLLLATHQKFKI